MKQENISFKEFLIKGMLPVIRKVIRNILVITIILIIIVLALIISFCPKNFISLNGTINAQKANEIVIMNYENINVINKESEGFEKVSSILSDKKIKFSSSGLYLYDYNESITLKNNTSEVTYYFCDNIYGDEDDLVVVIIKDFFVNYDTPTQLDFPYYLVSKITLEEYNELFNIENNSANQQ